MSVELYPVIYVQWHAKNSDIYFNFYGNSDAVSNSGFQMANPNTFFGEYFRQWIEFQWNRDFKAIFETVMSIKRI